MDISFDGYDLQVRNRGDLVYFFKKNKLIHKWDNLIYNYMIDVYEFLRNIISNKSDHGDSLQSSLTDYNNTFSIRVCVGVHFR